MSNVAVFQSRPVLVEQMANHLVAAIMHGGLNTSSDVDVIECLRRAPDKYHYRTVLDHMDDALVQAKQILVTVEMKKVGA
jgi:hypothetical protein